MKRERAVSLKVGQSQLVGSAAATRAAAVHHGAFTGTRLVDKLSATNPAGPGEESFQFTDTWDELQQNRPRRRSRLGIHGDAVRFGSVLASEEVGAMMVSYRSQHEISLMPSLRVGAMLYDHAKIAISTGGRSRVLGGQLNRTL